MRNNRFMEDFLSNQWNLYGLQVLAGSLMVMILHNYLTMFEMCVVGLCVFLIAFSQRLLGIKFGMLFYETNKKELDREMFKIAKEMKEKNRRKKK